MGRQVNIARGVEGALSVRDFVLGLAGLRRPAPAPARAARPGADPAAICEALLSRRGEVSGTALAADLLAAWAAAPDEGRRDFLFDLLNRFGADPAAIAAAVARWQAEPGAGTAGLLHHAAEPRRQELFRRLNMAPGGTLHLVRMRAALLDLLPQHPELAPVDADFRHLFASWFNRGFLTLQPIDWDTPASILERIIRYEAVHRIDGWEALRRRLAPGDRLCFAFFHPQMRDEPLVFVEVALTRGIPETIGELLDGTGPALGADEATTAVFYSISNCQAGLRGISFGNLLIKQVVADLRRRLPKLSTFVTLSPVPGFAAWLARQPDAPQGLDGDWADDPARAAALKAPLMAAAARYLARARRGDGLPADPVARFHLGNGAGLERINFLADRSAAGMQAAHGIMVNYLYDPARIEANHERLAERREVVVAPAIERLLPAGGQD